MAEDERQSRVIGLRYCILWMLSNGHDEAANALESAHARGEVLK
jgi:hypothetical protein